MISNLKIETYRDQNLAGGFIDLFWSYPKLGYFRTAAKGARALGLRFFGQMLGRRTLYIKVLSLLFPTIPDFQFWPLKKAEIIYLKIHVKCTGPIWANAFSTFFKDQNWKFWYRWNDETFILRDLLPNIWPKKKQTRGLAPFAKSVLGMRLSYLYYIAYMT